MQSAQSLPEPMASMISAGRFGSGLRGLCNSPSNKANLHQDSGSNLQGGPQRSAILEPVLLGSPQADVAISYFTYGSTKDTMIRSPELHRHVLSTSFDAEAVRQVAQVCSVSNNLQGHVDLAAAGIPMAGGSTAPSRSPYLQPVSNRNRGLRPHDPPAPLPGLPTPLRPLSSLLDGGVAGSPTVSVGHAHSNGGISGGSATYLAIRPGYEQSQATVASNIRGSCSTAVERNSPVLRNASRVSLLSTVYGQPAAVARGGPCTESDCDSGGGSTQSSDEGAGGGSRGDGIQYGSDSLRHNYLNQYAPPTHLPPPIAAAAVGGPMPPPENGGAASATTVIAHHRPSGLPIEGPVSSDAEAAAAAKGTTASLPPAADSEPSDSAVANDAVLRGHIQHLRNLHLQNHRRHQHQSPPSSQQQPEAQPLGALGSPTEHQQLSDGRSPLPALDLHSIYPHRASSASSACSAASSLTHNPISARFHTRQREHSLTDNAAAWRRNLPVDTGAGGSNAADGVRRPVFGPQGKPIVAQLSGTLADWVRNNHRVHSVVPDIRTSVQASGLWSEGSQRCHHRNGGGAKAARAEAAAGGGGSNRRSVGGEDLAALWGRPRRRRRPIHVNPELVRQYTERPPKLCTPNNASRPVTSSDFAAFKNHTVNRAGAANTLRTVLGTNTPAGGGGGSGGGAAAAVAEARGVTPLTTLLGPAWVSPAFRPRSPRIGVGGLLTGSKSVPGLHVPLELDPPPRPSAGGASAPSGHSHLFRRSLEFSDGVSSLGSPGGGGAVATAAVAAAAAAGDRTGTPLTASTFGAASSLPAPVQAVMTPRTGPPHVRCGAGELTLDVNMWLTPPTVPSGDLCGLFNGDDGESVALLSRVVKGVVQCDLGWAEVSESLMFMSTVTVPNAVLRFPVPHRAILQRFAATIGGTTLIAEAVARSSGGSGFELEEDEEDDDPGPGKVFNKGFGRRNHPPGPGGRAPILRVPLGKVRGDIFITISYIVQLEISGNTLSLTHVCNWTPARMGWHLVSRDQLMSSDGAWVNNAPNNRRSKHKASDLYDLSFELEVLSHRGLNLVSGPRHMTIKPNYDALLIQGYTQVWRPRHVTTVTFELALAVPLRSFAILHDAHRAGPDANPEPPANSIRRSTNASYTDGSGGGSAGGDGASAAAVTQPPQASTSLRLIVPTGMAHLAPGADNGKSTITLRSSPPAGALNLEPRPLSTRHCAAVTFVPGSHFSPAELEDVLGPEVAPGPRAQAAAIRAGLPGGPGPLPVELWVVLDCCGPAGIAAHVMQMLQTLQVLLRSLPTADGDSGGATTASTAGGGGDTTGSPIVAIGGCGSSMGGSTATGAGGGSAAAAVAAATLFNVVICPAAPLVLDPEDEEAALAMLPPELASLHLASRQQQRQHLLLLLRQRQQQLQLQQQGLLQQGPGGGGGDAAAPAPSVLQHEPLPLPSQPLQQREAQLNPHLLLQQQQLLMLQQDELMALPPVWLFPGGSRPVNAENVATALVWVEQLLADALTLAVWAQPVSALHDLLADMAWSPRPSACRRTAVVMCQQIPQSSDAINGDGGGHATAVQGRSVSSSSGARSPTLRRTGGGNVSRLTSKHLNAVNQAGKAAGGGGGSHSRVTSARLRLKLESESGSRSNSRPASRANSRPPSQCVSRPASRPASRTTSPSRSHSPTTPGSRPSSPKGSIHPGVLRRGLSFGDLPTQGYVKAAAAAVAAAASASQASGGHQDGGGGGEGGDGTAGSDSARSANAELTGNGTGGTGVETLNITEPNVIVPSNVGRSAGTSLEPYRPRSSLARGGGQGRSGGSAADGVRWSNGVVSNPRSRRGGGGSSVIAAAIGSGGEAELSDSDPEPSSGRPRATGPSPLRGGYGGYGGCASITAAADGTGTATSGDDEEELSTGPPTVEPPDVGFPLFVVVHELALPPSNAALAAGLSAATTISANSPSYLLAYQLYQKHIEALLYRQAREEVEQLPTSYFERLADLHGGFVQVVTSPLELSPALVLAVSCAVNGRYLRQLRLVPRGSVIREQFPAQLPPALPLNEPLTLLVRMSRMQPGAALELLGLWPNGRPAHMEVSVDPRLRTSGQLLPVLCALSEVSSLLNGVPFAASRVSLAGGTTGSTANGGAGGVSRSTSQMLTSGSGAAEAAAAAAAGWPPMRVTPQQQSAKRKATHKALAFNLITPFTAMALVSMTLVSNRGLTVQTLQTTQGRTGDQRHAFVWPAPVMGALTTAAKDAALHNNGSASPYHTASTFAAGQAAAAAQGQLGQGPLGQVFTQPGQLELPAELIGIMSGSMSMLSDVLSNAANGAMGGSSGSYSATTPAPLAPAAVATTAASTAASTAPAVAGVAGGAGTPEAEPEIGFPIPSLEIPTELEAVVSASGGASDLEQHQQEAATAGTDRHGTATIGGLMGSKCRRRSAAIQELSCVITTSAQAARRPSTVGLPPAAAASPDVAALMGYRLSSSGAAGLPCAGGRRLSSLGTQDFPAATKGAASSPEPELKPTAAQAANLAAVSTSSPSPALALQFFITAGGGASSPTPALAQPQPSSSSPFPSPKLSAGFYTPPMSPVSTAEAHQLTVLGRLAAMQAADGSWPSVPELEDPHEGGPKPSTQAEKTVAEVREVRGREALAVLRGQTLRGAVSAPCWSTVLALALLRAKYGPQRLAWIPMEAKAFSWLERKWPLVSVCGMSAPRHESRCELFRHPHIQMNVFLFAKLVRLVKDCCRPMP